MGSSALRKRKTWQDESGTKASLAENSFYSVLEKAFRGTEFKIRKKPAEFNNIYVNVQLSPNILSEIFTPPVAIDKHGIRPDYAIDNTRTKKTLYVEVKRQDGWVEGKNRAAGRGNAHERSCKYFSPGLLEILRERGGLGDDVLPFWTVFQGDITRDPCRVREVACWFGKFTSHYFMWRNTSDSKALIEHFNTHLRPLLS